MASHAPRASRRRVARNIEISRGGDGIAVCDRCIVADRMFLRMKGLLGKRELPRGEGMMIRPAPSIHTFFMRFPIDAVFVSRDGEVLRVASDVKSWRIRGCRKAHAVIELAAGEARRRGLSAGDRLVFAEAGP